MPKHTVLNRLTLLLLRVSGFAGGTDRGVAAGADFVRNGVAVGQILLTWGFVDALLVHHHALG